MVRLDWESPVEILYHRRMKTTLQTSAYLLPIRTMLEYSSSEYFFLIGSITKVRKAFLIKRITDPFDPASVRVANANYEQQNE